MGQQIKLLFRNKCVRKLVCRESDFILNDRNKTLHEEMEELNESVKGIKGKQFIY